ncbi:MAG: HD domain-containing protein [Planctomycetaceae bacterium]|nr:HD domain-containing protein [Planctomycetaceae bacterium]
MNEVEKNAQEIEIALSLAIDKHRGQRDADGAPYVLHLIRVMMRCRDPEAKQAGVLHDILEDTPTSAQELVSAGIGPRVVEAVKRLTHTPCIPYGDLEDNYSIGRVKYRKEYRTQDAKRLEKYILSHRFLMGQLEVEEFRMHMGQLE